MNSQSESFIEYFTLAQSKMLTERESLIIEMRYGFMSGNPHTLEAVGCKVGVSRERIRQIIDRSLRKIVSKGQRELKHGKTSESCAKLLSYIKNTIQPRDEGAINRLIDFVKKELNYLPENQSIHLVAYLAFQSKKIVSIKLTEARKIILQNKSDWRKDYKKKVLSHKFHDLISNVIWPGKITFLTSEDIEGLERNREILVSSEGTVGVYFSNKMHREIQYESELELNFYQWIEKLNEVVFYQEQPYKIPYNYEDKSNLYYPDVLIITKDRTGIVVEIKPIFQMALHKNLNKWTGLKKFCADKGLGLLVTDGRYTINQIMHHEINPDYAKDVLSSLKKGALYWKQYKQIRDKYDITRNDFVALVLNEKLVWKLNPFLLSIAST